MQIFEQSHGLRIDHGRKQDLFSSFKNDVCYETSKPETNTRVFAMAKVSLAFEASTTYKQELDHRNLDPEIVPLCEADGRTSPLAFGCHVRRVRREAGQRR